MKPIDLDVIQTTLHLLAASIWIGGQIIMAALVGPLRKAAPQALAPAARAFAVVAWPAYAVLILTGFWILSSSGDDSDTFQTTLMVKLVLVVLSGIGAGLHATAKTPAFKGIWGAVGLLGALGALILGISL